MGKDSPSPPPAPDYTGAAQAQGAANVEAARLSARMANPNIIGPYGSQTISYGQPFLTREDITRRYRRTNKIRQAHRGLRRPMILRP